MLHLTAPFVLLDDARPGGAPARLYQAPARIIEAHDIAGVLPALAAIRAATQAGQHAAGYIAYEAAAAFEPVLGEPPGPTGPLLWFGLFDSMTEIAAADVPDWLPDPAGAWVAAPTGLPERASYDAKLAEVLGLITAGDLYQANLTFGSTIGFEGNPLAVYAQLRARSGAGYGAYIDTGSIDAGSRKLLSLSPELFFALQDGKLHCQPMKGTARRGADAASDAAIATALAADPKQRAENLMIVDLIRNDVSRVAVPGSVAVPSLFAVETYPTIHQLVSTVTADLAPDRDAIDVMAAMFPCGSITGAPKIRAMQAIAAIEQAPRGPYTGAIGRFDAGGDAMFNVAIRTLLIEADDGVARFGSGGGIVADSQADEEWDETRAKGGFLTAGPPAFDLIETMAFHPQTGIALLDLHLSRMKASASRFGFAFDRHAARNELQAATFRLGAPSRVRLMLAPSGAIAIESTALPAGPDTPVTVAVAPLPVDPADFRLRHKTTDRGFYDAARRASGAFEVVFIDGKGLLREGSFTTLFVQRGDVLITPSLAGAGMLPGVLRAELIARGEAIEGDVTPADLAQGFFIGNALRGLIPAILATDVAPPHGARL